VGVSCSKDSFVVNQTFVFQIKFGGKSQGLREPRKRSQKILTSFRAKNKFLENWIYFFIFEVGKTETATKKN
jgi:hypothetical protein